MRRGSLFPIIGLAVVVLVGLAAYVSFELIWQPSALVIRPPKGG
jgi:hypothetical protein